MECPNCGLINPDNAQRCDCGYDFEVGYIKKSYIYETANEKKREVKTGILNMVGGIAGSVIPIIGLPILSIEIIKGNISLFFFFGSLFLFFIPIFFYFACPISFIFNEDFLIAKFVFNIKLKIRWVNVKDCIEFNFLFYRRALIQTNFIIFIIDELGTNNFDELLAKINYSRLNSSHISD